MQLRLLNKHPKKIRGVNLGGWLVLEKWMTPSLFSGINAEDETRWCVELGDQAEAKLKEHWQSFITREDFVWLAAIGINAVRIPIGYWLFGPDYPYHSTFGQFRYPFVSGGINVLDQAFAWAEENGILIVLDLHAAPGCQNGFDNGGLKDICDWPHQQEFQNYSLDILERLAAHYRHSPALHGIEVLNEPRWDLPTDLLVQYTKAGYRRIRKHCSADRVAVVFHDGFRNFEEYTAALPAAVFANLIFDIHRYQCFTQADIDTDIHGHIAQCVQDWRQEAEEIIQNANWRTYVGEWSLGLNPKLLDLWKQQPQDLSHSDMDEFQQNQSYRAYAAAQLLCFEKYLGWFFWSYKTETMPHWSFRDCVARGWLPANFV